MILDYAGNPITSINDAPGRRGMQVDGFQLPDGAIVSREKSFRLHNNIKNNTLLRERLEVASRMTGRTAIHLSMLRPSVYGMSADVERAIVKNVEFGEKIQHRRVEEEKLKESGKAYENSVN